MTVAVLHLLAVARGRLLPLFVVPFLPTLTLTTVVVFVLYVPPMPLLVHRPWFIPA